MRGTAHPPGHLEFEVLDELLWIAEFDPGAMLLEAIDHHAGEQIQAWCAFAARSETLEDRAFVQEEQRQWQRLEAIGLDMTLIRIGLLDACPDAFDAVHERERALADPDS